jgi:glycosyltransferase involved in cell wall biosynthesis
VNDSFTAPKFFYQITTMMFSIVVPTLNSEQYIAETLESLRAQEFTSFEVIVVDGGSTDGTLDIVSGFGDTVDLVLEGPDSGQAEAFNKGFRAAQGEYFLWVNGDDLLHPNALKTIHRHIRKCPSASWFNLGTVIIDEVGKVIKFHSAPPWNGFVNSRYRPQVSSPTTVFHRELLERSGSFDERFHYSMDVDLWRRFVSLGAKWQRIPMYGFFFRRHKDSKTNTAVPASNSSQSREAKLMAEKHVFDLQSWVNIIADKVWRFVTCRATDEIYALRWAGKDYREFVNRSR